MLCLSRNPQSGHSGPGSGSAGLGFLLNSIHFSPTRNLMDEWGNSYGVVPGGSGGLAYIVVLVLVVSLVEWQLVEGVDHARCPLSDFTGGSYTTILATVTSPHIDSPGCAGGCGASSLPVSL